MRTPFQAGNYEGVDRIQHLEDFLALTYQTLTATLTLNRAGGFTAEHVFDLGQEIATVSVLASLTAETADGETFGNALGNIAVPAPLIDTSPDDSHYTGNNIAGIAVFTVGTTNLVAVNDVVYQYAISGRYLKVVADLDILGTGLYNGANNPTATVDLTVARV